MPHPQEIDPRVRETLRSDYGLAVAEIRRVAIGQATANYQVRCADGSAVFVKHYQPGTDLAAEEKAIGQTEWAGQHGVPVAPVRHTWNGRVITQHDGAMISVWNWIDGDVVTSGFSHAQQDAAGQALGRIHRLFATQGESREPAPNLASWLAGDVTTLRATIDELLEIIAGRAQRDDFDSMAERTLRERRAVLDRVPDLLAGLPTLSAQVLHGDYSAVNLLFRGQELAAVLDFRPPEPFLTAYELGRIAFDPRIVCRTEDWPSRAYTLIDAYLRAHPDADPGDVTACARVALLQLMTSLYGVKNHYLKPGLLQADLDAFWTLRHQTTTRLLGNLDDIETSLDKLAHGQRNGRTHT